MKVLDKRFLLSVALATLAGILTGVFGLEGTLVLTPGLLLLGLESDFRHSLGTAFAALVFPITLLGAYKYYQAGDVDVPEAILIGTVYMIFAYLTVDISFTIPSHQLRLAAGTIYMLVGAIVLWSVLRSPQK